MTTLSVHRMVTGVLEKLELDESSCTKFMTGGPDGDLGCNEIRISKDKIIGIVDGSGVLYDPAGLDREELLQFGGPMCASVCCVSMCVLCVCVCAYVCDLLCLYGSFEKPVLYAIVTHLPFFLLEIAFGLIDEWMNFFSKKKRLNDCVYVLGDFAWSLSLSLCVCVCVCIPSAERRQMIRAFDDYKLGSGGFKVLTTDVNAVLPSGEVVESGLAFRNTFHLRGLS
eukprot:TRINITY_DN8201_c1_g2_i1.p1 TRINITY_DN8201_c1_g2~~TRINITY_DN8201_c1_g2_i1.p1  ORF type:complete len:225 (-),score=22.78 TRINITY_DN8201_c1_g2_i1:94-768(-)